MTLGDPYALSSGRTVRIELTAGLDLRDALDFIDDGCAVEVDRRTGVAYTREVGCPIYLSELSPWRSLNVR